MSSTPRTDELFLSLLREHGARRVQRVRFRRNRSTIWSLTRGGTVLNLHSAYRDAPRPVVRCLAIIAEEVGTGSKRYHDAAGIARNWPGVLRAIEEARAQAPTRSGSPKPRRCAGTPAQRRFVRQLYRHLNATRFENLLPDRLPVRLSDRMTSRLGQMVAAWVNGRPRVVEIALNVDLLLEGNAAARLDTMLHEMAHAAAFLLEGERGHGSAWKAWAERAGCDPRARAKRGILRRRRGTRVTHVPRLPGGAVQLELAV